MMNRSRQCVRHKGNAATSPERLLRALVALDVASELRLPVAGVAARSEGVLAAIVAMPKTAVDKDGKLPAGVGDGRTA